MRLSKFKDLVADEFGATYGAVICRDLVLTELADQTADQALVAGIDPGRFGWLFAKRSLCPNLVGTV
jgi:hypothetical protein